jgi:hypothetical protein
MLCGLISTLERQKQGVKKEKKNKTFLRDKKKEQKQFFSFMLLILLDKNGSLFAILILA